MAKETTFRDLLMKISNVYPSDMYLIYNSYVIPGSFSDDDNNGEYLCILTPELKEICNKIYSNEDIVYISNIKNAKDKLEENSSIIKSQITKKEVLDRLNEDLDSYKKIDSWNTFSLTEKELDDLYTKKIIINLFEDDDKIPTVSVSKKLFPLINEKQINEVIYNNTLISNDEDEIRKLTISFDYAFFQLILIYKYMAI